MAVAEKILSVIIMILIGFWCRRKNIVTKDGLGGIKAAISNIMLPAVLFNAFFTAEYSLKMAVVFLFIFAACGIALTLGFALRKNIGKYGKFFPFLITGFEGGMLGYPLYGLLAGAGAISVFAVADIGQTMFAYTVFLAALKAADGQKPSPKALIANMLRTPPFIGMALGIILGITGVNKLLSASVLSGVVNGVLSFLTEPTAALILIVVGYELAFKKELMKPVLKTAALRLLIMVVLCTAVSFGVFALTGYDRNLFVAFLLMFSLPAPFIIPLFADVGEDAEYISTSLSVSTIITIILYTALSFFIG